MEFDKYLRLGDYHWREYARPSIYRDYVDGLREWVQPGKILDVGAGDGLIASIIGAEGIEFDSVAVGLAKEHGVNVIQGDARSLPHDDASFEAVFMGDVIEHLADPSPALREAHRVLENGGVLYVTTPPARDPVRPYHYREYTSETLQAEVERFGFSLIGTPFTRCERIHAVFSK